MDGGVELDGGRRAGQVAPDRARRAALRPARRLEGPQILAADADVPEMPARNHHAIVWQALIRLATHDEAFDQLPVWQSFLSAHMDELRRTQLPRLRWGDPLA